MSSTRFRKLYSRPNVLLVNSRIRTNAENAFGLRFQKAFEAAVSPNSKLICPPAKGPLLNTSDQTAAATMIAVRATAAIH